MGKYEDGMRRMFVPQELVGDSTSDVLRQNFYVMGKNLDDVEENADLLLKELFPDTTEHLLEDFERVYRTQDTGTLAERRSKVIAGHRARGGLSKVYFETLGDEFGGGNYTVVLTEGAGLLGFIVHEFSPNTSPAGPATLLPGQLSDSFGSSFYEITVTVTGVSGPEPELEDLRNIRRKVTHEDKS